MPILLHGTTRQRAEEILLHGPDPDFIEPGGGAKAEGFSMCLENGPFPLGHPADYAYAKSRQFPAECGAAIVAVDVPDQIIALAVTPFFPLTQGLIQFDSGAGLEVLRAAWPGLTKDIRSVECP